MVDFTYRDETYVFNRATRYLARTEPQQRHNYLSRLQPDTVRGNVADAWRFPVLDGAPAGTDANEVTFIYRAWNGRSPAEVAVAGTFGELYQPIPMKAVGDYFSVTVTIPFNQVHRYRFRVDGTWLVDPINPQQVTDARGETWSRFFTDYCTQRLVLETWEANILDRLTALLLPFRTELGRQFLDRSLPHNYRLDESVGVVNYIDKILAREENHRLFDYRTCLSILNEVLRARDFVNEPEAMSRALYEQVLGEMESGNVAGWDLDRYGNPNFFVKLLKRHTVTGAFCHPKYGGNVNGIAWAYLEERFRAEDGGTLFNWRQAVEQPLGNNPDYNG
ncbi:gluconate 2-dehydrogenase subunit 3 family protein [Acanthopleuribacter pedis]|nr:gluconate 2-dehydrogenase subunit 3 family protein [Acanthopleuribacter pedis]